MWSGIASVGVLTIGPSLSLALIHVNHGQRCSVELS